MKILCLSKKFISKDLEKQSVAPYTHKCKVQYYIILLIWKTKEACFSQANSSATWFLIHTDFFFIKKRLIGRRLNDDFVCSQYPSWNHGVILPVFITPAAVSMENCREQVQCYPTGNGYTAGRNQAKLNSIFSHSKILSSFQS